MEVVINHNSKNNLLIDEVEQFLLTNLPIIDAPVDELFTENLYVREMTGPANSFITSAIHKTEHIFIVSQGTMSVLDEDGSVNVIQAPFKGITKPGTRRFAYVWPFEDCIWTTVHFRNENETAEQIGERILEKHTNPLLTDELKEKMLSEKNKITELSRNYSISY